MKCFAIYNRYKSIDILDSLTWVNCLKTRPSDIPKNLLNRMMVVNDGLFKTYYKNSILDFRMKCISCSFIFT